MYRLCTFLAGELEKLRNKRKFAISVFVISEFLNTVLHTEMVNNLTFESIMFNRHTEKVKFLQLTPMLITL